MYKVLLTVLPCLLNWHPLPDLRTTPLPLSGTFVLMRLDVSRLDAGLVSVTYN